MVLIFSSFHFSKMSLFGLDEYKIEEAKVMYLDELRKSLEKSTLTPIQKAHRVINSKKTFFAAETPELHGWLAGHGFLQKEDILLGDFVNLPVSRFQKIAETIDQTESLFSELISELEAIKSNQPAQPEPVNPLEKAKSKFLQESIRQYIKGGCTPEEAKEEANNDWEDLEDEEKMQWISK